MKRLAFGVVVFVMFVTGAFAQNITGTITGTTQDQTGAVLPGVEITVVNVATALSRTVITGEVGVYVVPLLPAGNYRLTAVLPGFTTGIREGIVLQVSQRVSVDFEMRIGALTETVLVTEAAPLVDSETSSVGNVIENRRVVELPLNGREFQQLTLLVPGAMPANPGSVEQAYGAVSVAGTRETSTAFTLDGMDIVDGLVPRPSFKPSVEIIQEFKVMTSTYAAELGRTAGGQVIVTTKSGSNAFHGSVFHFLRNSVFDAKNFFDPPDQPIPGYKRNNFGATLGGPVVPNRTFFFVAYEGLRTRQAQTRTASVPSLAMVAGDFSELSTAIRDPFTGEPFPGNVIPEDRINPVGQNIARLYPAPNLSDPVRNFVSSPTYRQNVDQYTTRLDHSFSNNNNFFVRYTYNDDFQLDVFDFYQGITNLPGYGRQDDQTNHSVAMTDTHVFTPNFVGEFRLGYNRYYQLRAQENRADIPGQLGIPGTTKDPRDTGFPDFGITGFDTIGKRSSFPSDRMDNTYQLNQSLTYTRGGHTIKFGTQTARFESHNLQNGGQQGRFRFDGRYSGNSLADVLLGFPRQTRITRGDTRNPIYRVTFAGFLQDDWKVTPRLTLNLGIRYDLVTPVVSCCDRMSNFNPETGIIEIAGEPSLRRDISRPDLDLGGPDFSPDLATLAQSVAMVNTGKRSVYSLDHNDFAPRIGLAYRILDNDQLVLRTGYGIYYDMLYLNSGGLGVGRNYPFKVIQTFNANATTPNIRIDDPFPVGFGSATVSPRSLREEFRTGYVHQYNFGFQYQPFLDLLVDLKYVGSKSTKLSRSVNINQAVLPSGPNDTSSVSSRRPFQGFGSINLSEPAANANFNSLQLRLERRFSDGLTLLGAYTWSKSIDDHSGQRGSGDRNVPLNHHDFNTSMRGLSNFDARHRLVLSYIYELPFGNGSGFGNWLINGWQLSGITTFQSGRPLTPNISSDLSRTGNTGGDRPILVGNPVLPRGERTPDRWFNTDAFELPAGGTFGNSGRSIVTGPGINNWDFSLIKNNRFGDNRNLQFRTEIFNLANHPQFAMPNRSANSQQFGKIFETSQFSRQIQFALKILF
jgi:hypothetical protein